MSIANIINKSTQLIDTKYIPPYDEILGYGQFSSTADSNSSSIKLNNQIILKFKDLKIKKVNK